jgi:hypothetical protein
VRLVVALSFVVLGCTSTEGSGGGDATPALQADGSQVDVSAPGSDANTDATSSEGTPGDGSSSDSSSSDATQRFDGSLEGGSPTDGGFASEAGVHCWPGTASFPTFDKHCSVASDCALVVHTLSCCGNVLVMAINGGAVPAFNAAEATCNSQYPACGCASNSVAIEDGVAYGNVASPTSAVSAACVATSCLATFTGPTFPCGGRVCATNVDYCEVQAPADGAAPSFDCVFVGILAGDAGIGCANLSVAPGCTCAESQGHVTVTCS